MWMDMRTEHEMASIRRTTNLSLSQSVLDEARGMDVDVSKAAEDGIRNAIAAEKARRFREEFEDVVRSTNEYVARHGLPLRKYRSF